MDILFDFNSYDFDAERERVLEVWHENNIKYNWNKTEETLQEDADRWIVHIYEDITKAKEVISLRQHYIDEYNYVYPDVTKDNWRSLIYEKEFQYIPHHFDGTDGPYLLLGLCDTYSRKEGPIMWRDDIAHLEPSGYTAQTGGICCNHHAMHAIKIPFSPQGHYKALQIDHVHKCVVAPASLDDLFAYRTLLQNLGLDCSHSYTDYEEAWYPLDLKCLSTMTDICDTADVLGWILDTLVSPFEPNPTTKWNFDMRMTLPWKLVVVGKNCD